MNATKNGWTVEGTPREIAELIRVTTERSIYEIPEAIRQEQAKIDKQIQECKELERMAE